MENKFIGLEITGKGAKLSYIEHVEEHEGITNKEYSVKVDRAPSNSMKTIMKTLLGHALVKLNIHGGKIGEKEIKNRKAVDLPDFKGYEVVKFSLKGDGEEEVINIKIKCELTDGDKFTIDVPPIPIASGKYPHEKELSRDLDNVIQECKNYSQGVKESYFFQEQLPFPKDENGKFVNKEQESEEDDF